jgi:hypothetical protein
MGAGEFAADRETPKVGRFAKVRSASGDIVSNSDLPVAGPTNAMPKLAGHRFEWVLAGHGGSVQLPPEEMRSRLAALVERM